MLFPIIKWKKKIKNVVCLWCQTPDMTRRTDKHKNTAFGKLLGLFVLLTKFGKYAKVTCPLP